MILHIIRHGDPDYANDCLTDLGKRQAQALGAYLSGAGLTHLYASTMGRAQETAQFVSQATNLPVSLLNWTREIAGIQYDVPPYGRHPPFALPAQLLLAQAPCYEGWETQTYLDDPHLMERVLEIRAGSDALLADHGYIREGFMYQVAPGSRDNIAVVCHGGMGATWLSHLLHLPLAAVWAGMYVACTSVTALVMEERGDGLASVRMIQMGDLTHTRLADLPDTYRGLHGSRQG